MKALQKLMRVLKKETEEPFLIAEIGQAHEGSLGQVISFIEAAADSGADAVKLQTHIAAEESSKYDEFRVKVFPQDKSRYDYWKRMEFSADQWLVIAKKAQECGLVFLSSPFSNGAIEILEKCDVPAWKLASGELFNLPMLEIILRTEKPILISTGMSSWDEIDYIHNLTMERLRVIFQCTTQYPSTAETLGLNNITLLKQRYNDCVIGLSDHSGEIYPSIAAYALGARVFEVHVTWSKKMFGPDTTSSLEFKQLKELASSLANLTIATESPVDKDVMRADKSELVSLFGRGIYAKTKIQRGQVIELVNIAFLKPVKGASAMSYKTVLGMRAITEIGVGEPIELEDLF